MNDEKKNEIDSTLGKIFKLYRHNSGLTQSEVAEKLGISNKYISRIETGMGRN